MDRGDHCVADCVFSDSIYVEGAVLVQTVLRYILTIVKGFNVFNKLLCKKFIRYVTE